VSATGNRQIHVHHTGDEAYVQLTGEITEHTDFSPLASVEANRVKLDTEHLYRFNSAGVLAWRKHLDSLRSRCSELIVVNASPAILANAAMIADFLAGAKIQSITPEAVCLSCNHVHQVTLTREQAFPDGHLHDDAGPPCPECGSETVLDTLTFPERL
jgi:hypothetical protein